ncbi:MAG: zinc transporter 9 [Kiritimatiellia bacterium]|jgi:zinc transporter 9
MAGGSKTAVYTAIGANLIVTVAKFIGFALTGSGAMLSEAIHSVADVGNQTLLAVGMQKSLKPADEKHPYGYGLEAFVWSLISAVGIFFVGCGFSMMHAIQALTEYFTGNPHAPEVGMLAIGILIFSLVIEFASLSIAMWGIWGQAKERDLSFAAHLRTTDDPFGVAILLEDSAAVLGVLIALVAVVMNYLTHDPIWDAIGTLLISLLLGFVALFLIAKNKSFLIGKAVAPKDKELIEKIVREDPVVESVKVTRATVRGTDHYRVSMEIDIDGGHIAELWLAQHDINEVHSELGTPDALRAFLVEYGEEVMRITGDEIDRLERTIQTAMPRAKSIDLEPD